MTNLRLRSVASALAAILSGLALLMAPVQAAFPDKAIRLAVPFPAAGGTDNLARSLGDSLSRILKQPVIVENRPGAGTIIGNDVLAKSAPDGHTLLLNTSAIAIVPALTAKLPYGSNAAFAPITVLGRAPNVAVVANDSPFKNARELLAYAKSHPGKLSYASAGNGTSTHLAAELLKATAGIFVTHVPYRGASPAFTDLIGGQIELGFATLPSVAPLLASGKLRALAVTSAARSPLLPEVPTFAEAGVAGYAADVWYGLYTAAGTPAAIVELLYSAISQAATTESFRKRATAEGLVVTLDSPAASARITRDEESKWRKVIRDQGIQSD